MMGTEKSNSSGSRCLGRRSRVRTGCLTCRSRKVKCDEARPYCYNCTRLNKACLYQPPLLSDFCAAVQRSEGLPTSAPDRRYAEEWHLGQSIPATMRSGDGDDSLAGISWSIDDVDAAESAPLDFITGEWGDFFPATMDTSLIPDPSLSGTPGSAAGGRDDASPAEWPSYTYFLSSVEPPFITPWDSSNWTIMKSYMCQLATSTHAVAMTIRALEVLWRTLAAEEENAAALSKYFLAKSAYLSLLKEESSEMETVLIVTLLLCCFEMQAQHETIPITLKQKDLFVTRLEQRPKHQPWSPVSSRIICWLQLFHTKAMHLGGRGVLSPRVLELLPWQQPTLSLVYLDPARCLPTGAPAYDMEQSLFQFYCELQRISTRVSSLNRHHRPRGDPEDEQKVEQISEEIEQRLRYLWQGRPWILDSPNTASDSFHSLSPAEKEQFATLTVMCKLSYHAEIIYHARGSGTSPYGSNNIKSAREAIRDMISQYQGNNGNGLHPASTWPLFLYIVESTDSDEATWGLEALEKLSDPVWNTAGIKDLIGGLSREQIATGARVDSRYFSIDRFGAPPPFM